MWNSLRHYLYAVFRRLRRIIFSSYEKELAELKCQIQRLQILLIEHPQIALYALEKVILPNPAVSIIMPTWNRAQLISDAIRSVQAQYYINWELIIIDDGSTDNTEQAVATFTCDTRICYIKQSHAGPAAARNLGLVRAKGAFVAYLDSDNLWYPGFLAAAVAAFVEDAARECLYGAVVSEKHFPRGQKDILFEPFDRQRLLAGNYIDMSSIVHRRELFIKYGGFDETLTRLLDWDLILRYTRDFPAYALPVLAVRYRAVDDKRISDNMPLEINFQKIVAKWKAE
jgi:glycosyltransferase involved in cell wall biosynthesis